MLGIFLFPVQLTVNLAKRKMKAREAGPSVGKGRDKSGSEGAHRISARVFGGAGGGDAGCASVCWDLRSGRGGPCAGDPGGCLTFSPQKWWKWVGVSGSRRSLLWGAVVVERWCGTRWWIQLLV